MKQGIMAKFCPSVNRQLLLIKFVMIGWFGAASCIHPFMSIHMREIGLSVQETSIIYFLLPLTQFLVQPIAGFIADKCGKYRDSLLVSIIATVILGTAMLYVPSKTGGRVEFRISHCANESSDTMTTSFWLETTTNVCDHQICYHDCKLFPCNNNLNNDVARTYNISTISTNLSPSNFSDNSCSKPSAKVQLSGNETVDSDTCRSWLDKNCSLSCLKKSCDAADNGFDKASLTFWLYTVLRVIHNLFTAIAYSLVDSTAIALTEPHSDEKGETSGQYGRQRIWAMISVALFSPIAGLLVDIWSGDNKEQNYAPAFYAYNVLALLTAVATWRLQIQVPDKIPKLKELLPLFRSPPILCLLLAVFWLGSAWGFLETFLFWFLVEELKSPNYLLGLTLTAGCIAGLPFLHYARLIAQKVGNVELLCVALFAYLVRCLGYSFLQDGWWCMPFEVLEIFTYHLMWVVVATYAASITPKRLLATVQGSIGGLHYGIGSGAGSLIGGSLMGLMGTRAAFQVMGGISGALAIIYVIAYYSWLRKLGTNLNSKNEERAMMQTSSGQPKESTITQEHQCFDLTANGEEKGSRLPAESSL